MLSVQISELRFSELEAAIAFARAAGGSVEPGLLRASLSLLARRGQAILGAALTMLDADGAATLTLCLAADGDADADTVDADTDADAAPIAQLARVLVDKALLKINIAGIHKCAVRVHGVDPAHQLWDEADWIGRLLRDNAA
ncbi:MAG TPA: hypothetical protein VF184_02455 [Phycisphaeraceae bacterium]